MAKPLSNNTIDNERNKFEEDDGGNVAVNVVSGNIENILTNTLNQISPYTTIIDEVSGTLTYIGLALPGSLENVITEFNTLVSAEAFAFQNNVPIEEITSEEREIEVDLEFLIDSSLIKKQNEALFILRQIFVKNTINGISTEQSKEIFRAHFDIIICILTGAFPTAYSMLSEAQPSGFITQEILDEWKALLGHYL